ncbi:MAG: transglycosylase SLT domain-containing protein, partial [Bacillus sp. (in: firmicutes)]
EMDSDFKELDRLVSPGKSAAKVPVLYDRLSTRFKSFTSKESELQSKLDKIMSDLNVPIKTVKNMLTAKSKAKGIPPEITKAIALQENAGLVQFLPNGEVFSSADQGYGIMQVTRSAVQESQFDWDQVKYDLSANIDNGLDILMEKWDSTGRVLPAVNTHNKSVLEDWYFAIMAYNGIGQRNNPTNINAYQMKVYSYVINNAINNDLLNPEIPKDIKFAVDPQTGIMSFKEKMSYETSKQTYSGQLFNAGDKVTLKGITNLRPEPNTSKPAERLSTNTKISIVEAGIEDNLKVNLFNWYKVKVEGSNKIGYIASNNFIQQIISDAAIRK